MRKNENTTPLQLTKIRTLFSRNHDIVIPRMGVFLAGPTPPDGEMAFGWRRKIIDRLLNDKRLNARMIIVSPEPETGFWKDIDLKKPKTDLESVRDKQTVWEWQYLNLCDITAFWLPTYWKKEKAEVFSGNIGPTSRFEFGYFLQEYLKNPQKKRFIIGSPEDADGLKWAKKISELHGIRWHTLKPENKSDLVAESFIQEIASTLSANEWNF